MISNRVKRNRENGKIFLPMNVDGGVYDEKFLSSGKLTVLAGVLVVNWLIIVFGRDVGWSLIEWIGVMTVTEIVSLKLIRVLVFEEKHFYNSYVKQKKLKKAKTYIVWEVTSIDEIGGEGILKYADGKKGVLVRLDRNTIVGRDKEFKEDTYDSLSEHYKGLNMNELNFVTMSTMDRVSKDVRLENLRKKSGEAENDNIRVMLEYQVGYILSISRATLFETESVLLYTKDISDVDLLMKVNECMSVLMGGAYIKYEILNKKDIMKFAGERNGVDYINYYDATLSVYAGYGFKLPQTFNINKIHLNDGTAVEVDSTLENRINSIAREKESGSIDDVETALIKAINRKVEKAKESEYKHIELVGEDLEIELEDDESNISNDEEVKEEDIDFLS